MIIFFLLLITIVGTCFCAEVQQTNIGHASLQQARQLILHMLQKQPLISVENKELMKRKYEYENASIDKFRNTDNRQDNLASAKIQILKDQKVAFFWRARGLKQAYFMDDLIMNNWECLDVAISPDEQYVACITHSGDLSIKNRINTRLKPITINIPEILSRVPTQKKKKVREKFENPVISGVVLWCIYNNVSDSPVYTLCCALGYELYAFRFLPQAKKKLELGIHWSIKHAGYITDVAYLQNKQLLACTVFDPKTATMQGIYYDLNTKKEVQKPDEALVISYGDGNGCIALFDIGEEQNGIQTIDDHEIAVARGLQNLSGYCAFDIDPQRNLVALLNKRSQEFAYYVPQVELGYFVPRAMASLVMQFNDIVQKGTEATGEEVVQLLREVMAVYKAMYPSEEREIQTSTAGASTMNILPITNPHPTAENIPAPAPVPVRENMLTPAPRQILIGTTHVLESPAITVEIPALAGQQLPVPPRPVASTNPTQGKPTAQSAPASTFPWYTAISNSFAWVQNMLKAIGTRIARMFWWSW